MLDNDRSRALAAGIVNPVARGLLALRVGPDAITVVGSVGVTLVSVVFVANGQWIPAAVLLPVLLVTDLLDGTMARLAGRQGPWGSFLDSTTDRITDGVLFAALAYWAMSTGDTAFTVSAGIALIAGFVTSYIRAKAESIGVDCKVGIAERAERVGAVWFGVALAALGFQLLPLIVHVLAALSVITVGQRVMHVRRALRAI